MMTDEQVEIFRKQVSDVANRVEQIAHWMVGAFIVRQNRIPYVMSLDTSDGQLSIVWIDPEFLQDEQPSAETLERCRALDASWFVFAKEIEPTDVAITVVNSVTDEGVAQIELRVVKVGPELRAKLDERKPIVRSRLEFDRSVSAEREYAVNSPGGQA